MCHVLSLIASKSIPNVMCIMCLERSRNETRLLTNSTRQLSAVSSAKVGTIVLKSAAVIAATSFMVGHNSGEKVCDVAGLRHSLYEEIDS